MNKEILPNFYGILEVKHYIKGRIRLKLEILKDDFEKSEELKSKLLNLNGIEDVKINSLLGTMLIKFNEEIIEPIILIGVILNFTELEEAAFSKKSGKIFSGLKEFIEMSDLAIYNKTKGLLDTKTIIAALFIFYGIRKLKQNPVLPNGVNLLWWAYNILAKGER